MTEEPLELLKSRRWSSSFLAYDDSKYKHNRGIAEACLSVVFLQSNQYAAYIEMPFPQARIFFKSDKTDGDSVHNHATPTTALMTSLAMI